MADSNDEPLNEPLTPAEWDEQVKRVERQVVELVLTTPFFASLTLNLKRCYTQDVDTMAVDGVNLFINPAWCKPLDNTEILGVLIHEAMHCALCHMWRRGDRDPRLWNEATDQCINLQIQDCIRAGLRAALPKGGLCDPRYTGLSAEQIYPLLPQPPKNGNGGGGNGKPDDGKGKPSRIPGTGNDLLPGAVTEDAQTAQEMQEVWRGRLVQAAQTARMQGNLPAGMARLVDSIVNPKVPWRDVLRRFLTDTVKNDYDWMRPDRRFAPDLFLPSLGDEECAGEIVIAVDTSGSIDGAMIASFFAEINAIHQDLKPSKLHVIYCDAAVHEPVDTFEPEDEIIPRPKGGGGTSFAPVFDWLLANDITPAGLVYLTDLYGTHWKDTPHYPVLWACWSPNKDDVPFGEVVTVEP